MELLVARRRHPDGRCRGSHFPILVLYHAQRMGHGRYHPLLVRYADVLHRIHSLSRHLCLEQMEGATAKVGPRRHLLAHCGFLLPYHPDCFARPRLLGLEPLHLYLGVRHCRNGDELCPAQGPQQPGNHLLCGHGTVGARGFQASVRFRIRRHGGLDHRRGRVLHYGSRVLQHQQEEIHAFRVPFLCFGR